MLKCVHAYHLQGRSLGPLEEPRDTVPAVSIPSLSCSHWQVSSKLERVRERDGAQKIRMLEVAERW